MSLAFSKGVGLFIIKKLNGIEEAQQKCNTLPFSDNAIIKFRSLKSTILFIILRKRRRGFFGGWIFSIYVTYGYFVFLTSGCEHATQSRSIFDRYIYIYIYISRIKKDVYEEMKVTLNYVLHMLPAVVLLLTMAIEVEANVQQHHKMDRSTSTSLFINKLTKSRTRGCKPGGCGPGKTCCGTTCVDNNSDTNHCGVCGLKCPFSWKCCDGECANVKFNPSHCGKCGNKCGGGNKVCMYSLCNYVHEIPPWTTRINATDVPNTASSTDHQGSN
ncbi:hypothetical protein Droror1_Dr00014776 [Drosera rotundifolia]